MNRIVCIFIRGSILQATDEVIMECFRDSKTRYFTSLNPYPGRSRKILHCSCYTRQQRHIQQSLFLSCYIVILYLSLRKCVPLREVRNECKWKTSIIIIKRIKLTINLKRAVFQGKMSSNPILLVGGTKLVLFFQLHRLVDREFNRRIRQCIREAHRILFNSSII